MVSRAAIIARGLAVYHERFVSQPATTPGEGAPRDGRWEMLTLALVAPLVGGLCLVLWHTPFPVSEAVALFEDVSRNASPAAFFNPQTSYYRPFFHASLWAFWHHAGTLGTTLALVKLLQIVPVLLLAGLLVRQLRPRRLLDAAVATTAVAVLLALPAFRDNVEIPLAYTTVGMPVALAAWMLMERAHQAWHGAALVVLTVVAVGFKEQGLVLVPLVLAAWVARAPGVRIADAGAVGLFGVAYLAFRLLNSGRWPMFEQEVGFGFGVLSSAEATERFGDFPYPIYAYNGLSTVLNVLFSEPTSGVFRTLRGLLAGEGQPLEVVALVSSGLLTALVVAWAYDAARRAWREGWSPDARAALALVVVLAGSAALSFNYSRDRLGGMAVPFYALAAYAALRWAALGVVRYGARRAHPVLLPAAAIGLLVLAGLWQLRALDTIEFVRGRALGNQREWMTDLPRRRVEFADRPEYLGIMERLVEQGTASGAPVPTDFRRFARQWVRGR